MQPQSDLHTRIAALSDELLAFLRRRTPDAEEIAQETWLKVALADPLCPDDHAFRGFVYVVARRLLIDAARRNTRRVAVVPLHGGSLHGGWESTDGRGPHDELAASEALEVVETTLARMRPEIAEVFRLRMTSDLSFAEIAARQGVGLNTALGRHHRATQLVAEALRARGLVTE